MRFIVWLKSVTALSISVLLAGCSSEVNRAPVVSLNGKSRSASISHLQPKPKPIAIAHKKPALISQTTFPRTQQKPEPITRRAASTISWQWPVRGPLLRHFHHGGKGKGIDIGGSMGSPVKAAAKGRVVYSGNALKGYGNLIIIKHDEDFLSAYAHNRELKVKEGEGVRLGQEIANMGKTGAEQVKLHFEIRYKGKPVDPIQYLPKR